MQEPLPIGTFEGDNCAGIQTFTAGRTGMLDRVDLPLFTDELGEGLIVYIVSFSGGGVLGGSFIDPSTLPTSPGPSFTAIPLQEPAPVTAGNEYAMIVFADGVYGWWAEEGSYSRGEAAWECESGEGFEGFDFAFKTYVSGGGGPQAACWNDLGTNGCFQTARSAICTKDGFADVQAGQVNTTDPNSPYYGATSAIYVEGYGLVCSLSDIATYGGDPSAYVDAGYRVDETGTPAPPEYSDADFGANYEYYKKS